LLANLYLIVGKLVEHKKAGFVRIKSRSAACRSNTAGSGWRATPRPASRGPGGCGCGRLMDGGLAAGGRLPCSYV
jgi:hypothetical protein